MSAWALNDEQLMLLDELVYFRHAEGWSDFLSSENWQGGANGLTLGELLEKFSHLRDKLSPEQQKVFDAVVADDTLTSLRCAEKELTAPDSDHQIITLLTSGGDPILIFEGTQPGFGDIGNDIMLALWDSDTPAAIAALIYAKGVYERYGRDLTLSGHSLGGFLASYVTMHFDHVYRCITLNAPGFTKTDYGLLMVDSQFWQRRSKITAYNNDGDIVHSVGISVAGVTHEVHGTADLEHWSGPLPNHDISCMLTFDDGVHFVGYSSRMPMSSKTRDFTEETEQKMLSLINQVEEDVWWKIWTWDCWLDVEQIWHPLTPDNYQNDMDSYYMKVMDKANISRDQINSVFANARARDNRFARTIQALIQS